MQVLFRTLGLHKLRVTHLGKEDRRASWLELFFDLVFVVCVSQVGLQLFNNLTMDGVWHFLALFIPILWCWSGATNFASRFDLNDMANRLVTGFEIIVVAVMALEVPHAFLNNQVQFIAAYLIIRMLLISKYWVAGIQNDEYRPACFRVVKGFSVGLIPIIVSMFVPHPLRAILWLVSCGVDILSINMNTRHLTTNLPHINHLPERYGLFFLIILGESITGVVNSLSQDSTVHNAVGMFGGLTLESTLCALMGLAVAFSFWWLYFDELSNTAVLRAYRYQDMRSLQVWLLSHFPLAIGLCACSVMVRKLILWPDALVIPSLWSALLLGAVGLGLFGLGSVHLASLCVECEELNSSLWIQHLTSGVVLMVLGVLAGLQWLPPMHVWTVMAIVSGVCVFQVLYEEIEFALSKQRKMPNGLLTELDPSAPNLQDGFELAES